MRFHAELVFANIRTHTPGEFKVIGGVNTYVTTPTRDYPKNKAVLYLADVFGPGHINAQLLADDFAENGFMVSTPVSKLLDSFFCFTRYEYTNSKL